MLPSKAEYQRRNSPLLRCFWLTVIAALIYYRAVSTADDYSIFDPVIDAVLQLCAAVLLAVFIVADINDYTNHRKLSSFASTAFGVLLLLGFVGLQFYLSARDRSPIKMAIVTKITDFNGVRIDFREDGTYRASNWCMGESIYRGKYQVKDSVITMDISGIDEPFIESSKLVVRADGQPDSQGMPECSVYQVDSTGQIILHALDFRVIDLSTEKSVD